MTREAPGDRLAQYRKAAEAGSPAAQYSLAKLYQTGDGVEQDLAEAFHWFAEAAQQDHPASILELGVMFRHGRGVEPDYIAGTRCLIVAALLGEIVAQGELSDDLEALQDLALAGDRAACRFLCDMYERGLGVDKNPALAWTWVRWARECCSLPVDEADSEWLEHAPDRFLTILSDEARSEGDRVFGSLVEVTRVLPGPFSPRPMRCWREKQCREGGDRTSA